MNYLKYFRDAAVFAPCYIALDWASYVALDWTSHVDLIGPFNITPWNPQPALAIVWMMMSGLAHAPAVLATIILADIIIRHAPGGYLITITGALILAGGYAGIAWALKAMLRDTSLRSTRHLTIFAGLVVAGTGIIGAAFVATLQISSLLSEIPFSSAWLSFWIGDTVGIFVTAPLLFAVTDSSRRSALLDLVRKPEALLQGAFLAATVWLIFEGLGNNPSSHFYLLFLPLIWIAVRHGMNGAILATTIVQLGVIYGMQDGEPILLPVVELQALMAALTLTGLFLGVMVDERQRAEAGLRQSLRLAAAGEMAGAIAHEVNQPLTAVANYGKSVQMLIERAPEKTAQIQEIIAKILVEAERASEVVRRLRDFFRAGTTRLEVIVIEDLLTTARRMAESAIGDEKISLEIKQTTPVPPLFVDRLQIEVVLRNLLANAVESLTGSEVANARISILIRRHDEARVCIMITDNGPGIQSATRANLFEPFYSGKSKGMGLGLAVSRAIAEAHGGTLESTMLNHGEFHLILPCVQNH